MIEEFEKSLKRVNFYLGIFGLSLSGRDKNTTVLALIRGYWIYLVHFCSFNLEVLAQFLWIYEAIKTGKKFVDLTRLIPCVVICFISHFKIISILYYANYNNKFIETMKGLLSDQMDIEEEEGNGFRQKVFDSNVVMLININKKTIYLIILGMLMFSLSPMLTLMQAYFTQSPIKLEMPFIAYYPFDEFDIRYYPWVYLHQCFSACQSILMVYGPDCFFYTCCTFLQIQFSLLSYDMKRIVNEKSSQSCMIKLKKLVVRHIELMRCVMMLEKIFSKSILFNALTSSILICVNGFNALVVDNIILVASFSSFFIFGVMEIFLYCYYGDTIMRSSMQVGDALYNGKWLNVGAAERRGFLMVMIRAQTPCELTANGFFPLNLRAFTSILSTSWSYFALLTTMYQPE